LNSKELSPTCHPVPRLVPITIPRQSSRCVRATRTGWLMYAVNAVIAQYVETVNDHRRWECYVSTAYEHTNKHYLVSNVPQKFRDRHGNPIPIATRSIIGLTVLVYVLQWAGQLIPGFPPIDQWL